MSASEQTVKSTTSDQPVATMVFFRTYALLVLIAGMAVITWRILIVGNGTFTYVLDDAYIHLSIAENILNGGYGINSDEYSSPSSSMLYPFLLAGLLWLGFGDWGPLLMGAAGSIVVTWLLAELIAEAVPKLDFRPRAVLAVIAIPFILVGLNLFALPFTGMEHTLHIAASMAVIVGLTRIRTGEPIPRVLIVGIILCPLFRFEGIALSMAAIGGLVWLGRWRSALVTFAAVAACGAIYAAFVLRLGLPLLPSSVLIKSNLTPALSGSEGASVFKTVLDAFRALPEDSAATLVLSSCAMIGAYVLLVPQHTRLSATVGFVAGASVVAQFLFGDFGWYGRYEAYALAIAVAALIYLGALPGQRALVANGAFLFPIYFSMQYFGYAVFAENAARSIAIQQYQMHRFATEFYPGNVAVNDIGYVSYRNDAYVLDLWGLASEDVRNARRERRFDANLMDALVRDAGADYAMIYDSWFAGMIPGNWCRIAILHASSISEQQADVSFYVRDRHIAVEMLPALRAFEKSLPSPATLTVSDCSI